MKNKPTAIEKEGMYMHLGNGDYNIPYSAETLKWELKTGQKIVLVTLGKIDGEVMEKVFEITKILNEK